MQKSPRTPKYFITILIQLIVINLICFSNHSGQSRLSFFTGANKSRFWFASIDVANVFFNKQGTSGIYFHLAGAVVYLSCLRIATALELCVTVWTIALPDCLTIL